MQPPVIAADGSAVFRSRRGSLIHAVVALTIWIGVIHFHVLVILSIFFVPFFHALLISLLLLFLIVVPVDEKSQSWHKLRRYIFEHVSGYFPITVHVEDLNAFKPNEAYVFAFEPHSVLPVGVISLVHVTDFVPLCKYKVLASSAVFRAPFLRHVWTWMGLAPITKRIFTSLLESGYSCVIIPGGVQETLHMRYDTEIAYLKTRRGFVRTAIETGRALVPVYCIGQSFTYKWWKPNGKLFLRICKMVQYVPMVFWGAFGSFIPHRVPLYVVVGKPIGSRQNNNPTTTEVNELHAKYLEALQDLFERHKSVAGYPDRQLKII